MNIVMILDEEFPPDPRVQNEASTLIKDGHNVSLLCLDFIDRPELEEINGINVFRIRTSRLLYKLSSLAYTFPIYRWILTGRIKKFLNKHQFDAIHVHDMRIGNTILQATKHIKVPKILDLHENRPEIMQYYEHVKKFPGNVLIFPRIWKKWEEKLINRFDKCVVVTKEAKQQIAENYGVDSKKIIVFPNTVHSSFYVDKSINETITTRLNKKFSILYVGDTGQRRGLETAIYAVKDLAKSIPNILLTIVGESKYDNNLKNLVGKLGVNEFVSFEGYQNMDLFQSYISGSKLCISPLHRNIHHDTTYANKVFQYMSLGVPVLVSDCTSQKNIIEKAESGLVHEAENVNDFKLKVLELFNNPDLGKKLGKNGRQFIINEFNQDITSKEMLRFYKELESTNV